MNGGGPTARVAVAVATFRRPTMLRALLESLDGMRVAEPFDVVVVDNDPDASAVHRSTELSEGIACPVRFVHEPEPGISAARNAALDAVAEHELVAFIDDDEVADVHWLDTLLRVHDEQGTAGVTGPVLYDFAESPPTWAVHGGFYMDPGFADGADAPIAGTNNLLLDVRVLQRLGLRFDPAYGLTGGSDIVLTRALTDAGERIVYSTAAIVRETVPPTRCRRKWLVRRAVRTGNSYARMELGRRSSTSSRSLVRVGLIVTGALRIVVGAGRMVGHPRISRSPAGASGFRTALRGVGVVGAALSLRVTEYARG